jgi:hypothetical protein
LGTAAVGLLVLLAGCSPSVADAGTGRPDGRMVLVSGRDDHGEVVDPVVPVYGAPASTRRVGGIADGTLAHVTGIDGTWLHVVSAEGAPVDGWVDDFFLRGVVHAVGPAPSCRVALAGELAEPGQQVVVFDVRGGRALVQAVDGRQRGWVPRDALQELGPQGPGCGDMPPGSRHAH